MGNQVKVFKYNYLSQYYKKMRPRPFKRLHRNINNTTGVLTSLTCIALGTFTLKLTALMAIGWSVISIPISMFTGEGAQKIKEANRSLALRRNRSTAEKKKLGADFEKEIKSIRTGLNLSDSRLEGQVKRAKARGNWKDGTIVEKVYSNFREAYDLLSVLEDGLKQGYNTATIQNVMALMDHRASKAVTYMEALAEFGRTMENDAETMRRHFRYIMREVDECICRREGDEYTYEWMKEQKDKKPAETKEEIEWNNRVKRYAWKYATYWLCTRTNDGKWWHRGQWPMGGQKES